MALTKVDKSVSSTPGIVDNSDATAITIDSSENVGIGVTSPFSTTQITETGWSSGAPYGTVLTVTGNNTNDANWGHLLITDSSTGTGNGGMLRFATGSTSSDMNPFAGIDGITEGGSYGGLKFLTRPNGGTATERMRIDSSGNVGIGTTSPTYKLDVKHDNVGEATIAQFGGDNVDNIHDVRIYNSSQASGSLDEGVRLIFQLGNTNTGWIQAFKTADGTSAANRSGGLAFHTSNANSVTEKMRIDSSGEIHINKTSTINNGQLEILAQANHQAIVAKVQTDTKQNFLGYNSSGQVTSYISGNGNYYLPGTNASDRDLKENILSITESSLAKVKQLEPKTFNFKESEGFQTNKKTGFIAQEVAEIFGTENGVASGTDGKKDMGINSIGLIAHLTKAIQEQQDIIEDLKSRIETLEG